MTKCVIDIVNEITTIIRGLSIDHREQLYEKYGFYAENYKNHPKVQSGLWDGKYRFFSIGGVTYTLLLEQIIKDLVKLNYDVDVNDNRYGVIPNSYIVTPDIFKECFDKYGNPFQLRDYQCKVANLLLEHTNGVVVAATSAGKGSIICSMAKAMISTPGFKVIIIVPSDTLVRQSINECKQYNLDVGEFSGTSKDTEHPIVVSTWQTLQNHPHVLKDYNGLVTDECHGSRALILRNLLSEHADHISMRFGVTGTMPKNLAQYHMVTSCLGPVRYTITAKWLQDNGWISTLDIKHIILQESIDSNYFPDYESETLYNSRPQRIVKIANIILEYVQDNPTHNILCLVNHKSTGKLLQELIEGDFYIDGDMKPASKRLKFFNMYATNDGIKGIATFGVASTGLSQDRIHAMFLIDIGKSFIKVIQSIGRGLRKGGGKTHVNILDISSSLLWSSKHRSDRNNFYNEAEYPYTTHKIKVD